MHPPPDWTQRCPSMKTPPHRPGTPPQLLNIFQILEACTLRIMKRYNTNEHLYHRHSHSLPQMGLEDRKNLFDTLRSTNEALALDVTLTKEVVALVTDTELRAWYQANGGTFRNTLRWVNEVKEELSERIMIVEQMLREVKRDEVWVESWLQSPVYIEQNARSLLKCYVNGS